MNWSTRLRRWVRISTPPRPLSARAGGVLEPEAAPGAGVVGEQLLLGDVLVQLRVVVLPVLGLLVGLDLVSRVVVVLVLVVRLVVTVVVGLVVVLIGRLVVLVVGRVELVRVVGLGIRVGIGVERALVVSLGARLVRVGVSLRVRRVLGAVPAGLAAVRADLRGCQQRGQRARERIDPGAR